MKFLKDSQIYLGILNRNEGISQGEGKIIPKIIVNTHNTSSILPLSLSGYGLPTAVNH